MDLRSIWGVEKTELANEDDVMGGKGRGGK